MSRPEMSFDRMLSVCTRALDWARERAYEGYNKHDGLNSPLLRTLSLDMKWPRILFIQGVMRSPVNIRPLLGVRTARNPKGIALFARACLNLFEVTGDESYRAEALRLVDWLLEHPSGGFSGLSWGYGYPWQDTGFYAPPGFPNRIVTYFVGRALVHAFESTGQARFLEAALRCTDFLLGEPKILFEDEGMKCVSYVPREDINMAVMDVSALVGTLCAMVGKHAGRSDLIDQGGRLLNWVADKQTDYGAWYYTEPPGDSHITHDNYHTGEIVDAFADFMDCTGDRRFEKVYTDGLRYYKDHLFTQDLRPKWMNDRQYPYDIHGYSQGVITFSRARDLDRATAMAANAIADMWDERDGRFYYQKRRFYTKRFTLMRWCQAWMLFGLSELLTARKRSGGT